MRADDRKMAGEQTEAPHDDSAAVTSPASVARPRGFLLVVVAAMVALAGVIAASQWQVASSATRTGTDMMAGIKSRAIADACLEKYLRYAKAGVDEAAWTDFDQLLTPGLAGGNDAISDADFIPPLTDCTAGVAYVPSAMRTAAEPGRALHRYCAMRMDGGACLVRFDDNSDDGKQAGPSGGVLSADYGSEGPTAFGGDNPRQDRDFSVLVTAIGIFPAKATTPDDDLYHLADARATKRALLQIEVQASTTGWPAIHADNEVILVNGAGGNRTLDVCGTGGIATPSLITTDNNDGCACGFHKITNGGANLQPTCSSCGSEGCATADPATYNPATDVIDADDCDDGINPGCVGADGEFDPDTRPPLPAHPVFYTGNSRVGDFMGNPAYLQNFRVAAPASAFARNLSRQTSYIDAVPPWVTGGPPGPGDPPNPICTYFFGGATDFKGRVTIGATAANHTVGVKGTPHSGDNYSPRAVYIWDHSDTALQNTLIGSSWSGAVTINPGPAPVSWTPFTAPEDPPVWPMATDISCQAWNQPYLPPPCDWNFTTDGSGNVTAVAVDIATCKVPQSLCWRPVALMNNQTATSASSFDNAYFLSAVGPGAGAVAKNREATKDVGYTEVFNPANGQRVPLVRGGAALTERTYGQFCGNASGLSGTGPDDKGPLFSRNFGRYRFYNDLPDDKWTSRGVYFIFDNEGNQAARAVTVEEKLGGDEDDKLRIGIITEGPIQFNTGKDRYVCCPTCNCNDHSGGPANRNNWAYSAGYFLYSGAPCAFRDPVKNLSGDISCEAVVIAHAGGKHAERTYSDVIATGGCTSSGCCTGPGCVAMSISEFNALNNFTYATSCFNSVFWAGSTEPGICIMPDVMGHNQGDLDDTGPWVGHLWARRDIVVMGRFRIAVRDPGEANPTFPYFPVPPVVPVTPWPETLHPEWPVMFTREDIGIVSNNHIIGKLQADYRIHIGSDTTVVGRLVAENIRLGRNPPATSSNIKVIWNGSGTSSTAVSDSVFYQDLGW
jgi:hypothetical protein